MSELDKILKMFEDHAKRILSEIGFKIILTMKI